MKKKIEDLNRPLTNEDIELVVKTSLQKRQRLGGFTSTFCQT